jgi:hypothetical protein
MSASPTLTGTVTGAASTWSGNVGIGTTSPAYALDVNGIIRAGANAILCSGCAAGYYQDASNGAYRSILPSSSLSGYYFQSNSGGQTVMYVGLGGGTLGNVGIGTTGPTTALQVNGTVTASSAALGYEIDTANCSNVGSSTWCTAYCTGSKHTLGGACTCSSGYMTWNQVISANSFACITGAACSGTVGTNIVCANIQ